MTKMRFAKDNEAWLSLRYNYITGTDVSTIFGINPYDKSVEKLLNTKRNKLSKFKDNFNMKLGRDFEDKIAAVYKKWHQNPYYISECGKYMATCDFVNQDETVLVELKTTVSPRIFETLKKVPPHIRSQVRHQYTCAGAKFKKVFVIAYLITTRGAIVDKAYIEIIDLPKDYSEDEKKVLNNIHHQVHKKE